MRAEHLSQTQLVGYEARTLNPEDLLAVDRHLASCDACHDELMRISATVFDRSYDLATAEPFHLDYDQHLTPYVDCTADEIDREIVESHVALCSQCAEDLRDLQEFRQQPTFSSRTPAKQPEVSRRTRWMDQWHWPRVLSPQLIGASVVAMFILGLIATQWRWSSNPMPRPISPVVTPSPAASPGQIANVPEHREPLVALKDGGKQITLEASGQSTGLESLPSDLRKTVENVLEARKLNLSPALGSLSESIGRLRGSGEQQDTIVPLAPVGVVVETDRPKFRWRALIGATDYVVTVLDSQLRSIESSGPQAGTEWSIQKPLQRGMTYSWQIRALKDGVSVISPKPPASEIRFRVLSQKALKAIEKARRTQKSFHLAMGVLYWQYGLIDAAEHEFEILVHVNPDSKVAHELLRSLRSSHRR